MYKTVLFDLDGTLLNTIDDLADSANRVCAAHGWPQYETAQYRYFVGNGIPKLVERFSPADCRSPAQLAATALVCVGVIGLGIVEAREDDDLRAARQQASNHRYAKSALALVLPIIYCLLDALGTFADSRVLETLDEDSANCAYELTFLLAAIVCFVYVVLIKKSRLVPKREGPKYAGALCETAGQFAYIYALADTEHVALAAPIISAYCVASVLWSRLFLKEKLSWKHYAMILLVVAGIVILGLYDA